MNIVYTQHMEGHGVTWWAVDTVHEAIQGSLYGVMVSPDNFYVSNMYVHPACRRQGVGSTLLQHCLDHLPVSVTTVTLDDCSGPLHGTTLYTRLGFQYVEDGYPEMVYYRGGLQR